MAFENEKVKKFGSILGKPSKPQKEDMKKAEKAVKKVSIIGKLRSVFDRNKKGK